MLSNPYIAGNPVQGQEHFIGRQDVLYDVEQTLRNPHANAIVLFGQRRIGKTSVLLQIEQELAAKQEFTPIYFDLQDKAALPLGDVLYQMAQTVAQITRTPLPERRKFDPHGRYFREIFMPQALQQCHNQGLALLLDEFDVLDMPQREQARVAFFPYLRDWMRVAEGLQFVFVLGRRPEELSTDTLSTFKGIRARRVSLMDRDETEAIIRQSERNRSVRWSDEAAEQVWHWTQGHPYFTQLLCSEVWESAIAPEGSDGFEDDLEENAEPRELPVVTAANVDAALDGTLDQGANALQWIWTGLPPAERIIMAAMAEASAEQITQEELTETLNRSKVRLILRDLELAPETLISWDLLRKVDESSYRFAIPLLRRWVAAEKPLRRVKADLDSIEPLAESLYQSAEGFYKINNLSEAERLLRNALDINPYHFKTRLRLAEVLLAKGDPANAVKELEPAYEFDPRSSGSSLVRALLALSDAQEAEIEQIATYDRILRIDPNQQIARDKKHGLLRQQAEKALQDGNLDSALNLYQEIGDADSAKQITVLRRKREIETQVASASRYKATEDWLAAIEIYQRLMEYAPEDGPWAEKLAEAQHQKRLSENYTRALTALEQGNHALAEQLFGEILGAQPDYKDAWRYLGMALKRPDPVELAEQKQQLTGRVDALERQLAEYRKQHRIRLWLAIIIVVAVFGLLLSSLLIGKSYYDKGYRVAFTVITPMPSPLPVGEGPGVGLTPGQIFCVDAKEGQPCVDSVTGMEFVWIPGGKFEMGCLTGDTGCSDDEKPAHTVTLNGFWMGKYEVTQAQWQTIMGSNPSSFKGENLPVETVSWDDVQEFIKKLNNTTPPPTPPQQGRGEFRLPSEAEWEYAARAGTTTMYCFGNDAAQLKEYAWYSENSQSKTHPVGQLKPNVWGLYDMHGNVWEWVQDVWHDNYTGAPDDGSAWEEGGNVNVRLLRGASYGSDAEYLRCANRLRFNQVNGLNYWGFRLARSARGQ